MVKHVVMWRLKEGAEGNNKKKNIELAKSQLYGLKPVINQIESIEVGENINSSDVAYDLVLITSHSDRDALAQYVSHPAHQEVAGFIGKVVAERNVVDFEY